MRIISGDLKGSTLYIPENKETRPLKDMARESGQIHILEAEWAYLNRPENLSILASQHLPDFGATKPSQIASLQFIKKSIVDGAPPP